jgi:hypothetical protein
LTRKGRGSKRGKIRASPRHCSTQLKDYANAVRGLLGKASVIAIQAVVFVGAAVEMRLGITLLIEPSLSLSVLGGFVSLLTVLLAYQVKPLMRRKKL